MIRITDRTLSCLDHIAENISKENLEGFLAFLIKTDVDTIEISEKIYNRLAPLPSYRSYLLRVNRASDAVKYLDLGRVVCRNADAALGLIAEIQLNDLRDAYTLARYANHEKVRVTGLDNLLMGNYLKSFAQLKSAFSAVEFCPGNSFSCAAALTAEWVSSGTGNEVVTSFGGYGGFAATEEIILILRCSRSRKVGKTYPFFPEMAKLFSQIITTPTAENKPIIGRRIFHVESGIHVDGIIKNPKCYEPFPPEVVGLSRKIVLGKHSGSSSVRMKMQEFGLNFSEAQIAEILQKVKALGTKKNGAVTDHEFKEICAGAVI